MNAQDAWIGHIVLFLTTVAGFVYQWFRDGRRHQWECEQIRELREYVRRLNDDAHA